MNILQIYQKYSVPPNLQQHMLWVAAVGQILCDNWKDRNKINTSLVVKTLLTHDMANIILFNIDKFPIPGESSEYWKQVQNKFKEKYGDEHHAVIQIAKELGLDNESILILDQMPGIKLENPIKDNNWELAICWYADFRIAPNGLTTFEKRLDDLIARQKIKEAPPKEIQRLKSIKQYGVILEKELQNNINKNLSSINDKEIELTFVKLKKYEI